jgi:Flp pilus assembly protein TadG
MTRRDARGKVRRQARPGQSVVELALLLPLLSLILLGAVDLGRAFFYYNRLSNSVEQGALYAIRYPTNVTSASNSGSGDPNNITYVVKHESASGSTVDANITNVTVTCYVGRTSTLVNGTGDCTATDANGNPLVQSGYTIVVSAKYTFRPITGQLLGILGNGYQMSKTVKMVVL